MSCSRAHNDAAAHAGAPLLPAAAKLTLERWVAAYDTALEARDAVGFLALRSSNLSRSLNLDEHVPNHAFFSYVNAHQPWIDALEKHMGLSALWRPRRSVLAIGAAHAMIDGYLSAKHGHTVVALDLPWIYLRGDPRMAQKLRRVHCSEILSSPLAISMLAHARLEGARPRCCKRRVVMRRASSRRQRASHADGSSSFSSRSSVQMRRRLCQALMGTALHSTLCAGRVSDGQTACAAGHRASATSSRTAATRACGGLSSPRMRLPLRSRGMASSESLACSRRGAAFN